jgi:hypothetical protein
MIALLLVLLGSVNTIHSSHSRVQTGYGKPGYNPDKMICVSRDVTGSRLESVRECHRAQEWEEVMRQERLGLMRRQGNGDPGDGRPAGARDTPW